MVKPVFIFCLIRSGSTLLQRVLMSHSKISSTAEPHFLLPFVYATKKEGTLATYSHIASQKALKDTINSLKKGQKDYDKYLREFSLKIYDSISNENSIYFVDKTPRYYSIIGDIERIFPDAKFIFLFRNPIQIYASVLETFSDKRFNKIHGFYDNITEGFEELSSGLKDMSSPYYSLNYKDLVTNPETIIRELTDFLELEYEEEMLTLFSDQKIEGQSKDPTGIDEYSTIDLHPLKKWKYMFNTKLRKKVITNYIHELSDESLDLQGYKKENLIKDIANIDLSGDFEFLTDVIDLARLKLKLWFKLNIIFAKNLKWTKGRYLN